MKGEKFRFFCFGEVLWDEVNEEDLPGGAPLNVSYHLAKDDRMDVYTISSLGCDEGGDSMWDLLKGWSIKTRFVQRSANYPTGKVRANTMDKENVVYEILEPVAWDYIEKDNELIRTLAASDCLVFGSLSCRNEVSRNTLFELLKTDCFKVFDINLRGRFYDEATLKMLLQCTDLLKINEEELTEIIRIYCIELLHVDEGEKMRFLMENFEIPQVIITRGAEGASFYTLINRIDVAGVHVDVVDTIGCGDAFLAGFLRQYFKGEPLNIALHRASMRGAFIAQKKGGCPPYKLEEYDRFLETYIR